MQQTKFDQYLTKKFALQTHVYTYQIPEGFKRKKKVTELKQSGAQDYAYLIKFNDEEKANQFVKLCRMQSLLFTSKVVVRKGKFAKTLARSDKSFTFTVIWYIILVISAVFVLIWGKALVQSPGFQNGFEAFKDEFFKIIGQ